MSDWTDAEDKLAHELNFRGFEMTQDEIIRMARELATRHGSRMCDEEGETHDEELYCVGVDDVVEIIKQVSAHEREKRTKELMQLFLDPENQPTQFGTATLECREEEIAAAYARGHDEGGKDFEAIVLPAAIAAEREACAKACEQLDDESYPHTRKWPSDCAAAIRARGNHG